MRGSSESLEASLSKLKESTAIEPEGRKGEKDAFEDVACHTLGAAPENGGGDATVLFGIFREFLASPGMTVLESGCQLLGISEGRF